MQLKISYLRKLGKWSKRHPFFSRKGLQFANLYFGNFKVGGNQTKRKRQQRCFQNRFKLNSNSQQLMIRSLSGLTRQKVFFITCCVVIFFSRHNRAWSAFYTYKTLCHRTNEISVQWLSLPAFISLSVLHRHA